jgi:hypothetical protein
MVYRQSWLSRLIDKAHNVLKWLLSALSAAATVGLVFVLESA